MAGVADDLIGDVDSASGTNGGALDAMTKGISKANGDDEAELSLVKQWLGYYTTARSFDRAARIQYTKDRKYAAGLSDPNWASDANLVGSFIDILVSFLFAQNPDAGCRPAEQVDESPNADNTKFARTLELVISRLWKNGKLKKSGKKLIRATLSVGMGWIKGTFLTEKRPAPQIEQELSTQTDQLARIQAEREELDDGDPSCGDLDAKKLAIDESMRGLQARLQKKTRYGLMCDLVRSEDVQVSLDVADITDYLEAEWMSVDIYCLKSSLKDRFPDLEEDDIKAATDYFQRQTNLKGDGEQQVLGDNAQDFGQYSKTVPNGTAEGGSKPQEFAKIIEIWDRKNQLVRTIVDGVKCWAVQPYPPPQATDRFYPLFGLALYPVDGQRHPQSLAWRLRKLQDEYSGTRSAEVLTRQRSVPGVIFNKGGIDQDQMKAMNDSVHGEWIGLEGLAGESVQNLFAQKPQPAYNPELYDTEPVLSDMERISGVQEALSQAASGGSDPKTATEANIEHQGFQSRTGADRDNLEDLLDELAEYTAECAIQECDTTWVQRVCGKNAFWLGPDKASGHPGMDVEDLLDMVEVEIDAGTTGKPNTAADKANWATILPLLEKSILQIRTMQAGDPGLAEVLINVLRETLRRLDDRLDLDEFIPKGTPAPILPPPPPHPDVKVNVSLTGALPPGDAQLLLENSGDLGPPPGAPGPGGPPGAPPGATGAPPGQPAPPIPGMPSHVAPGIPMPQLSIEPPKPPAGAGPPK